jgi:hypothetical protein
VAGAGGVCGRASLRSCTDHVQRHLIPFLGRIRLTDLTGRDVAEMFAVLSEVPARHGRVLTPSSLHRIRATLRAALNAAIRDGAAAGQPPGTCSCRRRVARRPGSGLLSKCRRGGSEVSGRRWRRGPSTSSLSSSGPSVPTAVRDVVAERWVLPVLGALADGSSGYEDLLVAVGEDITELELDSAIARLKAGEW